MQLPLLCSIFFVLYTHLFYTQSLVSLKQLSLSCRSPFFFPTGNHQLVLCICTEFLQNEENLAYTLFPNIMKFFSSGPSWVWENQKCRRGCCEISSLSLPFWSVFLPVPGWVWEATIWMLHWTLWVCRKAVKIANGDLRTQTIEVKGHWDEL